MLTFMQATRQCPADRSRRPHASRCDSRWLRGAFVVVLTLIKATVVGVPSYLVSWGITRTRWSAKIVSRDQDPLIDPSLSNISVNINIQETPMPN